MQIINHFKALPAPKGAIKTSQPKSEALQCLEALRPLVHICSWDMSGSIRRGYFNLDERLPFFCLFWKKQLGMFSLSWMLPSPHKNKGETFEILQQKAST